MGATAFQAMRRRQAAEQQKTEKPVDIDTSVEGETPAEYDAGQEFAARGVTVLTDPTSTAVDPERTPDEQPSTPEPADQSEVAPTPTPTPTPKPKRVRSRRPRGPLQPANT